MPDATLFLTPRQAWRRSGLPRDEIYRRLRTGELPALRVSGRFKIPARALESLVADVCAQAVEGRPCDAA